MSHTHFCDFGGHYWECDGVALRPLVGDTVPSICICLAHGLPMEDGSHSQCPVELLACAEHLAGQLAQMAYEDQPTNMPRTEASHQASESKDEDCVSIVGFCLWCNMDFRSMDDFSIHSANDSATCGPFQEYKQEQIEAERSD
jgi:hypothetical protein